MMHVIRTFLGFSVSLITAFALAETVSSNSSSTPGMAPKLTPDYISKNPILVDGTMAPKCSENYIKPDGTYGERALQIKKEILGQGKSTNYSGLFFGTGADIKGLNDFCPNFASLSDDEKLDFWIWTMAIIGNGESKCTYDVPNNTAATNGTAVGEYQTPLVEDGIGPSWRGPGCKLASGSDAYKTSDYQVACAVNILGGTLDGFYGQPHFSTEKSSYWQVIMKPDKNRNNFRDFKPCGITKEGNL